jgi:hypothetical protein
VCVDASIVQEQLTTSPDLAIAFMQQAFVRARHATQVARPHFFRYVFAVYRAIQAAK